MSIRCMFRISQKFFLCEEVTETAITLCYDKDDLKQSKSQILIVIKKKGRMIMTAIDLNKELFEKYVNDENKPVLVDFWAPWCVYCRRIAPALNILAKQYGDKIVIGKINIDDEQELAVKEQIEVIPTLVIYKGGQALASVVAPESKAQIEAFIKETLNL